MRTAIPLTVLATALAFSLASAPAHARARTFVASYGNDSNPCTFGSPCKTFQHAVDVVDAQGEVTAIDSAGFGPINITKAVTITSPDGVEAGIVASIAADAIDINAGLNDDVVLRGLTLNGGGGGAIGIAFKSGRSLAVTNCVAQNFDDAGIYISSITTGTSFIITNSKFVNNSFTGIQMSNSTATGIIDHVEVSNNHMNGIAINTSAGGAANIAISNSIAYNSETGIFLQNGSNGLYVSIDNTTVTANSTAGIDVENTAKVLLRRSMITENADGLKNGTSPNSVYSYGDNSINDNQTDFNGAAPLSVALR
jgi:hypothetical protein